MQSSRSTDKYPDKYKAACRHPYAFTRGALKETVRVLKVKAPASVPSVEQALRQVAVEKPSQHTGLASRYAGMADSWTSYLLWLEDNKD